MEKLIMKNISTATVIVSVPSINFRRELAPGRAIPVSKEQYDELVFDPGFDALMQGHYIQIDGLAEDERPIDVSPVVTAAEIANMFDTKNYTAFAKFIPTAQEAEKESIVKIAVDKKITDNAFVALIKKYCDVDIISAINIQHQLEE